MEKRQSPSGYKLTPGPVGLKSAAPDPSNRRQEARFELGVQGDLCVVAGGSEDAGITPTLVHDVSRTGLKLSTRTPLKPGEKAMVRFALPGGQARTRTVAVKWVKRVGGGFEAGAEAADLVDDDEDDRDPDDEVIDEVYYEAEAQFIDDGEGAPAAMPSHGAPTPPSAGRVAAAYRAGETPGAPPVAGLPVHVPRGGPRRGPTGPRTLDVQPVVLHPPRGILEIAAVTMMGISMGAILWLVIKLT